MIQDASRHVDVLDLPCDVTSESSVKSFIAQAVAIFGRIDYACNVAGVPMSGPSSQSSVVNYGKQSAITKRGTSICQRAELIQMVKQEPFRAEDDLYPQRGSIVNISCLCGQEDTEILSSYGTTKHSIVGLTKADALRVAKDYIRINSTCPGIIRDALIGEMNEEKHMSAVDDLVSNTAMGRIGLSEEVAEAALFLTSGKDRNDIGCRWV
ncbi:hypothetical protein BST61_g6172 [Cercospora zeina]